MLFIAICDDEENIGVELESILIDILSKLKVKHKIDVFFTGDELGKTMDAGAHYDLIFLDIELSKNESNGVEIGQLIRDAHENYVTSIVYISWEKKYALQLFDIQPLNFLIKPLTQENIEKVIRKYLKIAWLWSGEFAYKIGHDTFKVHIKEIIYLESRGRKLILHLVSGKKPEFYGSIKGAYQEQLHKYDFLFIHASYAVNYDHISVVKYNELHLADNSTVLPISPKKRNEVRERYYTIMKRRMR